MLLQNAGSHKENFEQRRKGRTEPLRTVVIDDSEAFLEIVCALLEREEDIDVIASGRDGAEAIELVEKLRPDLLVMDIDMPHLDGLNAALVVSTRFPSTEIILMSTEDSPELRADCLACGAVAFIHMSRFRDDFPFWLEALEA